MSLGFTVALLAGQLSHALPPMASNHWAIYVGSFVALGFILWTAPQRLRYIAAGANMVAAAIMAFLMLSWRYGNGVGWYPPHSLATAGCFRTTAGSYLHCPC